jgi:hypothetical protein
VSRVFALSVIFSFFFRFSQTARKTRIDMAGGGAVAAAFH